MTAIVARPTPLDALAPACCLCDFQETGLARCICPAAEKALRLIARGRTAMTSDQRAWCLSEIAHTDDFDVEAWAHDPDHVLAARVLAAWRFPKSPNPVPHPAGG